MNDHVIGIVGNPNCGKTTLFNALTGSRQRVGNWPGVTVERKEGHYQQGDSDIQVVDLPGIYALDVQDEHGSLDEKVARDYIQSGEAELIINIVDASNLERNLYLTTQLLEMRTPLVVVLNMMDIARERGIKLDPERLSRRLGCPVVPIVASRKRGINELKAKINELVDRPPIPTAQVEYAPQIEQALTLLAPRVAPLLAGRRINSRWLTLKLLEGDEGARRLTEGQLVAAVAQASQRIEQETGEEADILIADSRYGFIHAITREAVVRNTQVRRTISDAIDRVVLNRVLGIPIFLAAMYLMFMFTINIGGAFIDFFDILSGTLLVDGCGELLRRLGSPDWLVTVLADGVGGGVKVVSTFIPIIGFLYLFLSFLEDSGYMARAAFVMDRLMRLMGLPGKSFIPLLVGFGCNVPAIMATRTLENQRDRILTVAMNPFMSCGARLPVYALFAAAFFPVGGQNVVFSLYLIGIVFAILTGLVLKNTLLKGQVSPFVMELPPYHLPTLRGVVLRAWDRLKTFMFRAGKTIIAMVVVLSFFNNLGIDGSFGNKNSEKSVLSAIGRGITPVFEPLGIRQDNWPATVGIFTGVFAKEAVVGTLDALYTQLGGGAADAGKAAGFDLWGGINKAVASIPKNLADALGSYSDPLHLNVGDISNAEAIAAERGVNVGTFGAMAQRFDGWIGAFAYLLFILLYMPCLSATAATYRETNLGWTLFIGGWTTGLAYLASTVFYQVATFDHHPVASLAWIGGLLGSLVLVILTLSGLGNIKIGEAATGSA
jgi:ferrous iron transport protein B